LPESQFIQELHRYNGTPGRLLEDPEAIRLFLPMLRADFAIFETYSYRSGVALACPITALGGRGDGRVNEKELAQWHQMSSGDFTLHMFSGDHFFLNSQRDAVLQAVYEALEKTWSGYAA